MYICAYTGTATYPGCCVVPRRPKLVGGCFVGWPSGMSRVRRGVPTVGFLIFWCCWGVCVGGGGGEVESRETERERERERKRER